MVQVKEGRGTTGVFYAMGLPQAYLRALLQLCANAWANIQRPYEAPRVLLPSVGIAWLHPALWTACAFPELASELEGRSDLTTVATLTCAG